MSLLKSFYDTRNEFYSGHQLKDLEDIISFTKDSFQYPKSQPSTLYSYKGLYTEIT